MTSIQDALSVNSGFGPKIATTATQEEESENAWPFMISAAAKPAIMDGYVSRMSTLGAIDTVVTVSKWWPSDVIKMNQMEVPLFCTPIVNESSGSSGTLPTFATTHTYFFKESQELENDFTEPASYRVNIMRIDGMTYESTTGSTDGFQFKDVRLPCAAIVPPMTAQQCKSFNGCSKHGICIQVNSDSWKCSCNEGWAGSNCSECSSGHNGETCEVSCSGHPGCSGHGVCEGSGQRSANTSRCTCEFPFVLKNNTCQCEQCSGHGTCEVSGELKGKCACDVGFSGEDKPYCSRCLDGYFGNNCRRCLFETDGKLCAGHGKCQDGRTGDGTCICDEGWAGANCTTCKLNFYGPECRACPSCSGHGTCVDGLGGDGTCHCDEGWDRDDDCSSNSSAPAQAPGASTGDDGNTDRVSLLRNNNSHVWCRSLGISWPCLLFS